MKSSYCISISINIIMSNSIIISPQHKHQHKPILSSSISTSNSISINISIVVGYYISISRKELYQCCLSQRSCYVVQLIQNYESYNKNTYPTTFNCLLLLYSIFIILIYNQTLWEVTFLHEMTSLFF